MPDEHRGPAERQALDRELHGRDPADRLEDEVRAAVGQVAQRRDRGRRVVRRRAGRPSRRPRARRRAWPATRSIATIRAPRRAPRPSRTTGPTPPRPITATLAPAGTAAVLSTAPTPVETQQPMSAATAGSTPSGSGMAAAAGHDRRLGHRADPAVRQHRLAGRRSVSAVAPSGSRCRNDGDVRAGPRPAGPARPAGAARDEPRQRDRLADAQRPHARPDRLHHAGALVAHHHRRRSRPLAVADVQVGVADARGQDPHPDLAGARFGELEVLDGGRPARASGGPRARIGGHVSLARRRSPSRTGVYGT